ncbi:hypothetical protein Tco_0649217, partial [Tanacetum coccineum]
ERVKSILLLAIPDEYLLKFHNVADAKSLWEAIKSRFGRFQKLISQLEVHECFTSKEDIKQKFLISLPPSWNQIALIMRNKPDIDEIDINDLYNNLRVYDSCTNEVSTASGDFGVSTAGGTSQVPSTPCAHDVGYVTVRVKEVHSEDMKGALFARECRSGRISGRRSYGDNGRSNALTNESSSQALVAQDGLGYNTLCFQARSWKYSSDGSLRTEAAQQLFEQAPRYPEYAPEDHIPVYIPEPEHPEDLSASGG